MPSDVARQRLTESAAETEAAGERLGAQLVRGDMLLLLWERWARERRRWCGASPGAMGLDADVMSPTFQLSASPRPAALAHVDVYRLGDTAEIAELGLDGCSTTAWSWSSGATA